MKTSMKTSLAGLGIAMLSPGLLYAAAAAPEFTLSVSGATATDRTVSDTMLDATAGLCDSTLGGANAADVYTTQANFATPTNYVVVCKLKATITGFAGLQGRTVAMSKFSGGSGTGVQPVANGTALASGSSAKWVDIASATCSAATNVPATSTTQTYNLRTGCGVLASQIPQAGFSDVEPVLLGASAADRAKLTTSTGVAVVFAPVVSRNFFIALQKAQGLDANPACLSGGVLTGEVATATAECLPNLTTAQVRGMFKSGSALTLVNRIFDNAGTPVAITPAASGNNNINVCRRNNGSGTQASYETYYFSQRCGTAGPVSTLTFIGATGQGATDGCDAGACAYTATYAGDRVFTGNGAGDVRLCMDARNDAGIYAIGVVSTENAPNDSTNEWRFVKIDGAAPSLENTVAGRYSFFTESAFNQPNATAPVQPSADQNLLASAVLAQMRLPSAIRGSIVSMPHGLGGVLGIPTGSSSSIAAPYTTATVLATPVNSQTRATNFGGTPNNCNPPYDASRTQAAQDVSTN